MEGASRFESSYPLLVLTFEEKFHFRLSGVRSCGVANPSFVRCRLRRGVGSALGTSLRLRGRCDLVDCFASGYWRSVHEELDALMSDLHGRSI
jgi:hypothetical protein